MSARRDVGVTGLPVSADGRPGDAESSYLRYLTKVFRSLDGPDAQVGEELFELLETIARRSINEQSRLLADMFSRAARLPQGKELGFRLGQAIPMTAFGPLTIGYRIAPSVGAGLEFLAKGSSHRFPLVQYGFRRRGSTGSLEIGFRTAIDEPGEALFVSGAIAILQKDLETTLHRAPVFSRIELTAASAGFEESYKKHLSLHPRVGGKANRVTIPASILDAVNPSADVETFEQMVRADEEAARSRRRSPRMQDVVMERIAANIGSPPSLPEIAAELNLTERQLRFALLKNETSYRALVRGARVEQAVRLLCGTGLTVSQVADRLGYADVAAFSHSFHRWTGSAPSDVQRRGRLS